jgi:hypothetical protein
VKPLVTRPLVTVAFGGRSAKDPLPGWTMPFLVRTADRFVLEAANGGPSLRLVRGDRNAAVA